MSDAYCRSDSVSWGGITISNLSPIGASHSHDGGYIRITRVQVDRHTLLMHVINSVGDTLDLASARAILSNLVQSQAVERNVAQTLLWAVSDNSLRSVPKDRRDNLRASIFKQVLIHLV